MKIKKIILILIGCFALVLLSRWGISEVKEANLKKLHSEMAFTSDDIYQLIDDSPSFEVVVTYYDLLSQRCNYNTGGKDFILTQVEFEGKSFVVCITTYSDWEEPWNHAEEWNSFWKKNNWAIGQIMYSYGAVLVQINPIDEEFLEELNSLIMDSFK